MLSELIKSQSDQSHLNIIVSEGREDVCFRITNDFGTNVSCATKPLFPIHGLGLRPHQDTNFVQSMARYWQGEMETVKMGNLTSTYLHIKKQGAKECIPPVMQSVPHNWIATLLN